MVLLLQGNDLCPRKSCYTSLLRFIVSVIPLHAVGQGMYLWFKLRLCADSWASFQGCLPLALLACPMERMSGRPQRLSRLPSETSGLWGSWPSLHYFSLFFPLPGAFHSSLLITNLQCLFFSRRAQWEWYGHTMTKTLEKEVRITMVWTEGQRACACWTLRRLPFSLPLCRTLTW